VELLSIGKGGKVEPPVEAAPVSGKGGRLDPVETEAFSPGKGGREGVVEGALVSPGKGGKDGWEADFIPGGRGFCFLRANWVPFLKRFMSG